MTGHHWLTMMAIAIALHGSVGCGDDGSALQGIYAIDTWTDNAAGCDAEGESILDTQSDTALYLKEENFLGAKFLSGVLCADVAACAEMAADDETIHLGRYSFEDGSDADGWRAGYCSAFCDAGTCDGDYVENVLTSRAEGEIRLETRSTPVTGVADDGDGFCDDAAARAAAEGEACGSLEVIAATFDSGI